MYDEKRMIYKYHFGYSARAAESLAACLVKWFVVVAAAVAAFAFVVASVAVAAAAAEAVVAVAVVECEVEVGAVASDGSWT